MNFVRFPDVKHYNGLEIKPGVYLMHNEKKHVDRWLSRGCEVLEDYEGEALEYPIEEGRVVLKEEPKKKEKKAKKKKAEKKVEEEEVKEETVVEVAKEDISIEFDI